MVFELIRYRQEDVTSDNQIVKQPESLDIIVMDVLPTQINYSYTGKNGYAVGIGDDNVTVVRGGQAPIKISLQGTFGARTIRRGLNYTDGFARLKNFESMFRKSQSVNQVLTNNKPDAFGYIYGMNFYDFTHLHWGAVNLDTFNINKNAQTNTKVPSYTLSLTGMGALIKAEPKDPMLRNLKMAIIVQETLEQWNKDFEEFKSTSPILSTTEEVLADIETVGIFLNTIEDLSIQYAGVLASGQRSIFEIVAGIPTPSGGAFSFSQLLG